MPYDKAKLRLERFQADLGYHAAYNYWNLRGVLAERWAHGPIFGAAASTPGPPPQTTLQPSGAQGEDTRVWAVYGLRGAGMNAEGEQRVPEARKLLRDWIDDALTVLKPKRVVRASASVIALYPIEDALATSQRLRARFYVEGGLESALPDSLREQREHFHTALDFLVPFDAEGSGVSVIIGVIGPVHQGQFFVEADSERDEQWWMGVKYERRRIAPEGFPDARAVLAKMAERSFADVEHLAAAALAEVVE